MSANEKQVGGQHYREGGVSLQHWDVIVDYHIGYLEAVASKYLTRWRKKNGREDLEKAEHYVEKLLEKHKSGDYLQAEGRVPPEIITTFAIQNKIADLETRAITLLFSWSSEGDIVEALDIIRRIIRNDDSLWPERSSIAGRSEIDAQNS